MASISVRTLQARVVKKAQELDKVDPVWYFMNTSDDIIERFPICPLEDMAIVRNGYTILTLKDSIDRKRLYIRNLWSKQMIRRLKLDTTKVS